MIISILINFCGVLSNLFDSFNKSVMISVWIVGNNSHSTVDLDDLFPMRHFSRTIELNSFKFKGISISFLQLITPVFVYIPDFFNLDLFVILKSDFIYLI